jgi:hypothetical protein
MNLSYYNEGIDKRKYGNKCSKEYKSISPHSIGYINENNTKKVYDEA